MASTKAGTYNIRVMPPVTGCADVLVGGRLKACRAAQGRRISDVAATVNVSPARLLAIEAGLIRPSAAELFRITVALDTVLASLFSPADG